jgi:NifU-like protein involved in Fe-S cluster formation
MADNFGSYNKEVMQRFTNPKFMGGVENADGVGEVGNMKCGDVMRVSFKLDSSEKIEDVRFKTFGCVSAIAASDALCEITIGKTIDEAKKITNEDIIKELKGLPSIKVHCSVLGAEALKKAISDYESRKN